MESEKKGFSLRKVIVLAGIAFVIMYNFAKCTASDNKVEDVKKSSQASATVTSADTKQVSDDLEKQINDYVNGMTIPSLDIPEIPKISVNGESLDNVEDDTEKVERQVFGNGFSVIVPKGWHSNEENEKDSYTFSYSPISSRMSFMPDTSSSDQVVNVSFVSFNIGVETEYDNELAYLMYQFAAIEGKNTVENMAKYDSSVEIEEFLNDEEAFFNSYPAYKIKFSCQNDIASVDLTNAEYSTDENGITIITNYDSLPTKTKYNVPCWTTNYYIYNDFSIIAVDVTYPQSTENQMSKEADKLISSFVLTESKKSQEVSENADYIYLQDNMLMIDYDLFGKKIDEISVLLDEELVEEDFPWFGDPLTLAGCEYNGVNVCLLFNSNKELCIIYRDVKSDFDYDVKYKADELFGISISSGTTYKWTVKNGISYTAKIERYAENNEHYFRQMYDAR